MRVKPSMLCKSRSRVDFERTVKTSLVIVAMLQFSNGTDFRFFVFLGKIKDPRLYYGLLMFTLDPQHLNILSITRRLVKGGLDQESAQTSKYGLE